MDRTRSTLLMRVRDPAEAQAWGEFVALDEPLLTADRDTERGGVRPLADLPPLEAACRALQAGPGIETIRALAFPVQPQPKVEPAAPAGTGHAPRTRPEEAGTGPATARAGRSRPGPVRPAQAARLSGLHASRSFVDGYGAFPWNPARPGFAPSCGL
jgi:hypothetical protein